MQLALLKLSTANAFAKTLTAASAAKNVETSTSLSHDAALSPQPSGGPLFFPDEALGAAADCGPPLSPEFRGPYYGMYADYEDVMELLHSAAIADGHSRRLLSSVSPDQVVHVAHLGIGACCSVDLVALHCAGGSRLLAAAKSCYLPPSDPRLRASLREADLLRRCADCPFIIQLLAALQYGDAGGDATAPASPGSLSPLGTPGRGSLHFSCSDLAVGSFSRMLGGGYPLGVDADWATGGGACMGLGPSPTPATPVAAALVDAHMASPGYQAWAQWRGGGSAEDLERQIRQRWAASVASGAASAGGYSFSSCGEGEYDGGGGLVFFGLGVGGGLHGGAAGRRESAAGSLRSSLGGLDPGANGGSGTITLDEALVGGCGADIRAGGWITDGAAAYGYGGGWACPALAPAGAPRSRLFRRASMDVVSMYSGCTGAGDGDAAAAPGGAAEPAVMCTLLLGWARCGDLRRLVQLQLVRSAAHQNSKVTGAAPAVAGLPPLVAEDAARFYTGCVVLALEHLHCRLNTVHRDLKLSNLLLLDSGYVVVGDLGTAMDLSEAPGGRLTSKVGSPGHMAPECRDRDPGGYDTAADMWSLGACLFSLMTGQLPAGLAGPPHRQWAPQLSRHWSHELQDLLGRLLAWAPGQRPTAAQLLRDPWFRGFNWRALREQRLPPPSSMPWRELLWWPRENRQLL